MPKQKKKMLVVIILLLVLLVMHWRWLLQGDFPVTWRSYLGVLFFLPMVYLYRKSLKFLIPYTAFYLLAGALNLLTITPAVVTLTVIDGILLIQISEFLLCIIYLSASFSSLKKIYKGTWELS